MTHGRLLSIGVAAALCVDVRIDQDAYLNCLNEMFRAASRPDASETTQGAAMPSAPSVGLYNQAGIHEMLGLSFGHSVIPQRPPQPVPPRFPR
jgi:hypothetical protein